MNAHYLKCFHGHPAENILQTRKRLVEEFYKKYPQYFNTVADICAEEKGLVEDEIQQIRYGNTGLLLRLPDIYEGVSFETKEGKDYLRLKNMCNSAVIDNLKKSVEEFATKAKAYWTEQGNAVETFSLETFTWGEKEKSFSKKEKRAMNPASYINIRDIVIPTKEQKLNENQVLLIETERNYKKSDGYMKFQLIKTYINSVKDCIGQIIYRCKNNEFPQVYDVQNMASTRISCAWTRYRLMRQRFVTKMIEATTKSIMALNLADDGDGGFELSVVEDEFIFNQWYPQIKDKIRKSYEGNVDNINDFIDNLGIKTNLSYFAKHQNKKKYWFSGAAEQDLIIYNKSTNQVVACGEVKKNYYDIVHADHQLERNKVIISGKCSADKYEEYTVDTIVDRFVADPKKKDNPDFKTSDFETYINNHTIDFIITLPKEMQQTVPFCSKIATQVTHVLFSPSFTPADFIVKKIEQHEQELNLTSLPAILESKSVFTIKMQNTTTTIAAAPGSTHLQAQTVLIHLQNGHPEKMGDFQTKMKAITDSAVGNTISGLIDLSSLGIKKITNNIPRGGEKAIVVTRVDDGSWFKNFTGDEWRTDFRRIGGDVGDVEVTVEKIVVDFKKNESDEWELTNAVAQPKADIVTFGPNGRGVGIAQLIGTVSNPAFMADNFQKGGVMGHSIMGEDAIDEENEMHISLGELSITLMTDAIMPVTDINTNQLVPSVKAETFPDPYNIILKEGEESKCGDADRFAAFIISEQPLFEPYIKVFGSERENFAVMIGEDGGEHLWAKCEDHWETLIKCFANVCMPPQIEETVECYDSE